MLLLGDLEFRSRLLVETGRYADLDTMARVHDASGTQLVTVAVRRADGHDGSLATILDHIDRSRVTVLPTTWGCHTAEDAVATAHLAADLLETRRIKLDVIGCPRTLFPCTEGTLEAARELVREGFSVLPYCGDDPVICNRLMDMGCIGVMPLAAPIGSGRGVANPERLALLRAQVDGPLIVGAGLGTASDAARAMELGADAVLVHTAIAGAVDPVGMARAMRLAVEAGRAAFESGRASHRLHATSGSVREQPVRQTGAPA